jgi:hypothetical protein
VADIERKPRKSARSRAGEEPREVPVSSNAGESLDIAREECAGMIMGWDELPQAERERVAAMLHAYMGSPASPAFDVTPSGETGRYDLAARKGRDEVVNLLRSQKAFGTGSQDLLNDNLSSVVEHFRQSKSSGCSSRDLNAVIAFVDGANATNSVESTLALQMALTSDAALRMLRGLGQAGMLEQSQVYGGLANKLLNTFARQAEVLAKLQRGGEQVVRHVHVDNRGGQAIVTDTVVTGGANENRPGQPYDQSTHGPALLGHDTQGYGVPIASNPGPEKVPSARRIKSRRAEG